MYNPSKGFVAGLIIGAIAGAVTSLLYAPQSGEETRKILKRKAKEVHGKSKVLAKKMQKEMEGFGKKAKSAYKAAEKEFKS